MSGDHRSLELQQVPEKGRGRRPWKALLWKQDRALHNQREEEASAAPNHIPDVIIALSGLLDPWKLVEQIGTRFYGLRLGFEVTETFWGCQCHVGSSLS